MWDNFWRAVIFVALVAALTTCASCAMGGKKSDSDTVDDMAGNCKHGMKRGSIKQDGEETEVVVDCMPPGYSI